MFWLKFRKCIVLNRKRPCQRTKGLFKSIRRIIPTFEITFAQLRILSIKFILLSTNLSLMIWYYFGKTFLILVAMYEEAIDYVSFNIVIGLQGFLRFLFYFGPFDKWWYRALRLTCWEFASLEAIVSRGKHPDPSERIWRNSAIALFPGLLSFFMRFKTMPLLPL